MDAQWGVDTVFNLEELLEDFGLFIDVDMFLHRMMVCGLLQSALFTMNRHKV